MQQSATSSIHDRDLITRVLRALRRFTDAMDRAHSGMKHPMDLNATDLAALRMLIIREQQGRSVSPHEIARHLRISTASSTRMLDRLSASGHVQRLPHPSDRRARVVVLTQLSREQFFHHFSGHMRTMKDVAARFDDDELRVIARFLDELSHDLDPDG